MQVIVPNSNKIDNKKRAIFPPKLNNFKQIETSEFEDTYNKLHISV